MAFPGGHGTNGREQFFAGRGFEEIAARTGLHGAVDVFLAVEGGEHEDAGLGPFAAKVGGGGGAVRTGQAQIHEHDVRLMLAIFRHGFLRVASLGDHGEIVFQAQRRGETAADHMVIVHDEKADRLGLDMELGRKCVEEGVHEKHEKYERGRESLLCLFVYFVDSIIPVDGYGHFNGRAFARLAVEMKIAAEFFHALADTDQPEMPGGHGRCRVEACAVIFNGQGASVCRW